ncbi:hypothetical protein FIBSPDRAFT_959275 [Athelia psychrophila]|uniref:RSE1/DDB1/CPSF1 second beta-propeller domain-containing protein n=1 Tax=Athelia psychrophila TaxID=1759441 RepID=A0A166DR71_9AGAM|nr:hypothetical protein FIBSPDRAFT_959275 [Fibularhizoctonia sp. CBS 109695]
MSYEPEFSSTVYPNFGTSNPSRPLPRAHFRPRGLYNLALADELESLDPIVDSKTTKRREDDQYDSYIILSFVNSTLVLSIGETIEEVQDTGFLSSAP